MTYCDLLRMTVLLAAGAATALAAVTVIAVSGSEDTLTIYVAAVWWTVALVGGFMLGRPSRAAEAIRPALADARMATALPSMGNPTRAALARLWPIGAFALIAGVLGFVFHGVAAIGAGLRACRRAHLALARGCRRGDRGAGRRSLLRRAGVGAAAGQADPDPGPPPRPAAAGTPASPTDRDGMKKGRAAYRAPLVASDLPRRGPGLPAPLRSTSRRAPCCRGYGSEPASRRSPGLRSQLRRGTRSGIPP